MLQHINLFFVVYFHIFSCYCDMPFVFFFDQYHTQGAQFPRDIIQLNDYYSVIS